VYDPIYRLAVMFLAWCFLGWALFRLVTHGNVVLVDIFRYVPAICALGVLTVLICPFDVVHKRERDMFLYSIRRCLFTPADRPIYFSDVIFADIFTSFAKVLGDVWLSICMLLPGASILVLPTQDGLLRWILPTIMSLPYLVRLRQCIIEHSSPTNNSRRPLYNALKYASSFPVIFLSAAQRTVATKFTEERDEISSDDALFRLWLLAAAINSLYSFWWDVTNDWGLELLNTRPSQPSRRTGSTSPPRPLVLPLLHSRSPSGSPPSSTPSLPVTASSIHRPLANNTMTNIQPFGLRSTLLYPLPFYPLIIFLNLILRLTWSVKLSSHLHSQSEGSVVIFWLEMAEMVRRWMWVFVRVEWEVVKKMTEERRVGHGTGSEEEEFELLPPQSGYDVR